MAERTLFSLLVNHFSLGFFLLWGSFYLAGWLPLSGLEAAVSADLWKLGRFWRASFDVLKSRVALKDNQPVTFSWRPLVKGCIDDTTPC